MRSIGFFQVDAGYPVLISVLVSSTANKDFICTFDLPIDNIIPSASAFRIAGLTVVNVAKTGNREITVTTNEEALPGVDYVLCYNSSI